MIINNNIAEETEHKKTVIYIAFGYEYLLMALYSAQSLVRYNPKVETVVVSNVNPVWMPGLNDYTGSYRYLYMDEEKTANRKYKLSVNKLTEAEKVIYLDCDTEVAGSLEPLWQALDWAEIMAFPLLTPPFIDTLPDKINRSMKVSYYNGGVVAFRNNERVKLFFNNWLQNYERTGIAADQPTLAYTLNQSDLCFKPLSIWYNYLYGKKYKQMLKQKDLEKVVVHHYLHPHYAPDVPARLLRIHENIKDSLNSNCPDWFKQEVELFGPTYRYRSVNLKVPDKLKFYPLLRLLNRIVKAYYEKRYGKGRELSRKKERKRLGQ